MGRDPRGAQPVPRTAPSSWRPWTGPVPHARVDLTTGEPVEVSLTRTVPPLGDHPMRVIGFTLATRTRSATPTN